MPYIKQEERGQYNEHTDALAERVVDANTGRIKAGDLNYVFTRILYGVFMHAGTSYEKINALIGVLEACKLEHYRKMAAPYENIKNEQNGDIIGVH